MPDHVVKRGLDVPVAGQASGAPVPLAPPSSVAYAPQEFRGILPRLAVREGERVKAGTPLFSHKADPRQVFRSPVAGRVSEVRRGPRRVITDVVVERDGEDWESLRAWDRASLGALNREGAVEAWCASGGWGFLRRRPLDVVPDPARVPQSIFVVGTESGPLQPGPEVLLGTDDAEALQAAVDVLRKLTPGKVFLTVPGGTSVPALDRIEGVERHGFQGPHPSGDPAVQVNLLDPVRGTGEVWWIRAWDAAAVGRTLLSGQFSAERVYAAVGAGVRAPRFVRTLLGAPLTHIVGEVIEGPTRWIRGSVLTGDAVDAGRWASACRRAVHVLPDTVERELLAWALPSLGRWSFHRAFLSGFSGAARQVDLRPGLFGGRRAMIPIGYYSRVVSTPDIVPEFLFKSIIAGDLEESIQLGMLDLSEEEAALCTYICPSKIEFDVLLREGLELYQKEAG